MSSPVCHTIVSKNRFVYPRFYPAFGCLLQLYSSQSLWKLTLGDSVYRGCIAFSLKTVWLLVLEASPALGRGSPKLKVEVKTPKGKAPMPKLMWKPSPKPKPGNPPALSGSVRCPAGRGGTCDTSIIHIPTPCQSTKQNCKV